LSSTVRQGKSWSNSWKTIARSGPGASVERPATEIDPAAGGMKPATASSSVDFPQPDGPMTITFSRGRMSKVASARATLKRPSTQ
jgi:hypothetical protein